MKTALIIVLTLLVFSAKGQAVIRAMSPEDSVLVQDQPQKLAFYIAPEFELSMIFQRPSYNAGLSAGLLWHHRVELALFGRALLDEYQKRVVFPGLYTFNLVHGGVAADFWYPVSQKFNIQAGLKGSYGEMSWTSGGESSTDKFVDAVYFVTPNIGVSWSAGQFVKFRWSLSYQKVFDLQLAGVEPSDFDNFNTSVSIMIGNFGE